MLAEHVERGADLTVGCIEVPVAEAAGARRDGGGRRRRVIGFAGKAARTRSRCPGPPDTRARQHGHLRLRRRIPVRAAGRRRRAPGFQTHDFGKDIIPHVVAGGRRVYAHALQDSCVQHDRRPPVLARRRHHRRVSGRRTWTSRTSRRSSTSTTPTWPIWTHQEQLPPAKFVFDDPTGGAAGDGLARVGRLHRQRVDDLQLAAVLERPRAQLLQHRGLRDPARTSTSRAASCSSVPSSTRVASCRPGSASASIPTRTASASTSPSGASPWSRRRCWTRNCISPAEAPMWAIAGLPGDAATSPEPWVVRPCLRG